MSSSRDRKAVSDALFEAYHSLAAFPLGPWFPDLLGARGTDSAQGSSDGTSGHPGEVAIFTSFSSKSEGLGYELASGLVT